MLVYDFIKIPLSLSATLLKAGGKLNAYLKTFGVSDFIYLAINMTPANKTDAAIKPTPKRIAAIGVFR